MPKDIGYISIHTELKHSETLQQLLKVTPSCEEHTGWCLWGFTAQSPKLFLSRAVPQTLTNWLLEYCVSCCHHFSFKIGTQFLFIGPSKLLLLIVQGNVPRTVNKNDSAIYLFARSSVTYSRADIYIQQHCEQTHKDKKERKVDHNDIQGFHKRFTLQYRISNKHYGDRRYIYHSPGYILIIQCQLYLGDPLQMSTSQLLRHTILVYDQQFDGVLKIYNCPQKMQETSCPVDEQISGALAATHRKP